MLTRARPTRSVSLYLMRCLPACWYSAAVEATAPLRSSCWMPQRRPTFGLGTRIAVERGRPADAARNRTQRLRCLFPYS